MRRLPTHRLAQIVAFCALSPTPPEVAAQRAEPQAIYSTYLGGAATDDCDAVAVDVLENIYLGCHSESDSPHWRLAPDRKVRGMDAFVFRIAADGSSVGYAAHLDGEAWDAVQALAVDSAGHAYAVGSTYSADFPTTAGAHQEQFGGASDAFVAKISPDGVPIWVTYLGGEDDEDGRAIALDGKGYLHVVGRTASGDFPTTDGAAQPTPGGGTDAFLATFDPEGRLVEATYLGGSQDDVGFAVALDAEGRRYIAGTTASVDFPSAPIGTGGTKQAFVTTLMPRAASLGPVTLIGGSGNEEAVAIGVVGVGDVVIAGMTDSADLPVTRGAYQSALRGGRDAFVARLRTDEPGRSTYVTYLGGSNDDRPRRMVVDRLGRAFVAGQTQSPDMAAGSRIGNGPMGIEDAFVAVLDPNGSTLVLETLVGGSGIDAFEDIALSPDGSSVILTGLTDSVDFPTTRPFQDRFAGGRYDIVIVRLSR